MGASVWNLYGPTETTIWSLVHQVQAIDDRPVPIGRPIANTQVYVLDQSQQLAPIGVPGELYIGGSGVGLGYMNRPELTHQKFVHLPLNPKVSSLFYRTGDLGRYRADGTIEFLGRIDHQVKLRGFRIELGEIESALARHPEIGQAVVVMREDVGDQRLVAYVVGHAGHSCEVGDLRSFLGRNLPDYMLPSAYVFLDALPVTPNGKVDRRALPSPDQSQAALHATYKAPSSHIEKVLTKIWSEILKAHQVGVDDDFFELGGHSLLATQVVARIRRDLKVELPVRKIFENRTVSKLAVSITATHRTGEEPELTRIQRAPRTEALPLSFVQERLWFLDQLEPGNPSYNIFSGRRIRGPLNVPALERSINAIVARHEALRTIFSSSEGIPTQIINPVSAIDFPKIDLSGFSRTERESEVQRLATEAARRPFVLSEGPLFRSTLLRLGSEEHVLLQTLHHIIADGWSMGILYRELSRYYEAFSSGRVCSLPELSFQYADFAVWQRDWLQERGLESQLTFWQRQMANAPPLLKMPSDRPRPSKQSFRGASQPVHLPKSLTEGLKRLSNREGVTLFMTLLAAFKTLLCRYAQEEDVLVGSPIAGRSQIETEELIGFFVNMLVLRTDLSGNPTFRELLHRVRDVTLNAYANPDLPFEKLVEELRLERTLSYNPLFQVMFVLQNAPRPDHEFCGLSLSRVPADLGASIVDVSLVLTEQPEGLVGSLVYSTDLFDQVTICRMAGHYQNLLKAFLANPDERIGTCPFLTDAEREVVAAWNATRRDLPFSGCIHRLFEAQAKRTPAAIAVAQQEQHLTYNQVNFRANQLARCLKSLGLGSEELVGICMDRSPEAIVGLLAVLKAGGAYLPLDPGYPAERLRFMLEDANVRVVLTQQSLISRLPEFSCRIICLDPGWEAFATESGENLPDTVTPDHLAYVIYTSGSTGRPKGVMIPHRALMNYVEAACLEYQIGSADSVLQFASFSFDASVEEIFPCLICGGRLVLRAEWMLETASVFLNQCQEWGITVVSLPTAYWHELAAALAEESLTFPELLRLVIIGGERALPDRLGLWQTQVPERVKLMNSYGPTEATVVTTMTEVSRSAKVEVTAAEIPIGRPIPNVQTYVLDRFGQPLPVGVKGELFIGGHGLARGYLRQPELTADRFVPHPFAADPGARLYRTGDLARYLPDGSLEFAQRVDDQVKIRGFRIELREIEAVLSEHPEVRQTVVLVHEDEPGSKQLTAYIVVRQNAPPSVHELRTFLKQRLPEHMIPATFVRLDELPLTRTGKIDTKSLMLNRESMENSRLIVQPRNSIETVIASIWLELLSRESLSVFDNFFELGGHSLMATRAISRIRTLLRVDLRLRVFFESPTVAGFAQAVVAADSTGQAQRIAESILQATQDMALST
jgi:amino acid adenylation domain-containing protein